jgi:histidinol dehydrogenase
VRTADCDVAALLRNRRIERDAYVQDSVADTIADVRARGDAALLDSARKFDCPNLGALLAGRDELEQSSNQSIIEAARDRIRAFHEAQMNFLFGNGLAWQMPNQEIGQRYLPLSSVGVYVPGGKATYPSSVLMNAVPAQAAGVGRIVVATPAPGTGKLSASVATALRACGVNSVLKVGGAAAIAALAYGTESITPVDKIVGPGNRYVNEAKRQVWGDVGLDGYAGPSEVAVIADNDADPMWAAADLLTQVEHAEDNAGFLICLSEAQFRAVLDAAETLLVRSSREPIMRAALRDHGLAILARDLDEACDLANEIAPEHLSLLTGTDVSDKIVNAGCILIGGHTPESAADWAIGPSHTLPTIRGARFSSPLNVMDFMKVQSMSRLDATGLGDLMPVIEAFGQMEGFEMHARAARLRFVG